MTFRSSWFSSISDWISTSQSLQDKSKITVHKLARNGLNRQWQHLLAVCCCCLLLMNYSRSVITTGLGLTVDFDVSVCGAPNQANIHRSTIKIWWCWFFVTIVWENFTVVQISYRFITSSSTFAFYWVFSSLNIMAIHLPFYVSLLLYHIFTTCLVENIYGMKILSKEN